MAKPVIAPRRELTILKNMSAHNLQRLFAQLIHPDQEISPATNKLALYVMDEIA